MVYNLRLFDKRLSVRYFQEIDLKYVNGYNQFMEKEVGVVILANMN